MPLPLLLLKIGKFFFRLQYGHKKIYGPKTQLFVNISEIARDFHNSLIEI